MDFFFLFFLALIPSVHLNYGPSIPKNLLVSSCLDKKQLVPSSPWLWAQVSDMARVAGPQAAHCPSQWANWSQVPGSSSALSDHSGGRTPRLPYSTYCFRIVLVSSGGRAPDLIHRAEPVPTPAPFDSAVLSRSASLIRTSTHDNPSQDGPGDVSSIHRPFLKCPALGKGRGRLHKAGTAQCFTP